MNIRAEIERRNNELRRKRVSECVRALHDQRHAVRREEDRRRIADNARVHHWMLRFDACRNAVLPVG